MEIWKEVKGFENEYEVSNLGNLRSKDRFVKHYIEGANRFYKGQSKKIRLGKDGYYRCNLKKDSNRFNFRVHRLVAEAFIENKELKNYVNHINGIKTDNRVENLEWCSASENVIHAVEIGLIKTKINDIEALKIHSSKLSNRKLAKEYNVDSTIIWRIKNKKAYKHLWQQHYL
jgi:hypothetical protein